MLWVYDNGWFLWKQVSVCYPGFVSLTKTNTIKTTLALLEIKQTLAEIK